MVAASPIDLGEIVPFSRGGRSWRLTVPRDGSLPMGGLIPAFIEWSPGAHPSENMADLGLTLKEIGLQHPEPEKLQEILARLGVDHLARVTAGPEGLSFAFERADGSVVELA
nr:VOC family protein [Limimaricola pyoseonensis]